MQGPRRSAQSSWNSLCAASTSLAQLSSAGCDYIGVLDAAVGTFEMHTLNWDCGALPAGQKTDYDAIRTLLSNGYIPSDKRPAFLADTSLKAVAAALVPGKTRREAASGSSFCFGLPFR